MALVDDVFSARLLELEKKVEKVLDMLEGVASQTALSRIDTLRQSQYNDLEERVTALEQFFRTYVNQP